MISLNICVGSSCHLKGSYKVIRILEKLIADASLEDGIEMKARFCMQQCRNGVSVSIDDEVHSLFPENTEQFFQDVVLKKIAARRDA